MSTKILHIVILLLFPSVLSAQSASQDIREGNKAYGDNNFEKAEEFFRRSIQKDNGLMESSYNLGNSLYRQGKYKDAARYFELAASRTEDAQKKSEIYHNLGNSLLKSDNIKESIEAYKNALRQNPENEESRYNLVYANRLLEQQQEEDQKNENQDEQNDQDDQQDQDGDNKENENEEEQNQDQEDSSNEEQNEEQEEQQQQQQQLQQQKDLSRDDAERMLEALNEEEKKIQEKLKKKDVKSIDIEIEKDW